MNMNLTRSFNTSIKEALDFINEHKVLKVLVISFVAVSTCKAVFELGENFGHFMYLITH